MESVVAAEDVGNASSDEPGERYNCYGFGENGIHKATDTEYDPRGFRQNGIHKDTGTEYDARGFRQNGIHKDTGTEYDARGFDINRMHRTYDIEYDDLPLYNGQFVDRNSFDVDGNYWDLRDTYDGHGRLVFERYNTRQPFDGQGLNRDRLNRAQVEKKNAKLAMLLGTTRGNDSPIWRSFADNSAYEENLWPEIFAYY